LPAVGLPISASANAKKALMTIPFIPFILSPTKIVWSSTFRRQESHSTKRIRFRPCRLKAELQTRFYFWASQRDLTNYSVLCDFSAASILARTRIINQSDKKKKCNEENIRRRLSTFIRLRRLKAGMRDNAHPCELGNGAKTREGATLVTIVLPAVVF
jgi:hypothetical protein